MGTPWLNHSWLGLFTLTFGPFCAGVLDRSTQHHHDLLRDRGASNPLRTFEPADPTAEEGDYDPGKDRKGADYRRCRWGGGQIPTWNFREVVFLFYAYSSLLGVRRGEICGCRLSVSMGGLAFKYAPNLDTAVTITAYTVS